MAKISSPPWRQGVFSVPIGVRPLLRPVALEVRDRDRDEERDGMASRVAGNKDMDWYRVEDRMDNVWDGEWGRNRDVT